MKAVMSREKLLMKRNSFLYIFKVIQLIILALIFWVIITYYVMGFAPAAGRFFRQFLAFFATHLMAMAMFRFLGAILKTMVVAITFGMFVMLILFVFGGFVIRKNDIKPWWIWCYWASPMMYGQNAIAVNEFLSSRWAIPNNDTAIDVKTIGKAILKSKAIRSANTLVLDEHNEIELHRKTRNEEHVSHIVYNDGSLITSTTTSSIPMSAIGARNRLTQSQFALPFQPLSLCFNHLNYYVNMPSEIKQQCQLTESRLQLLSNISGAFRPGVLTALVGVSGAGKTTLMDVLAGRKTSGTIEGSITLSCGYCEQADIHSPNVTVYESILYSAWLRLSSDIDSNTRKMFVEEVMALVELDVLRNAMVGLPVVSGLSTEQRKRLTIAVELVVNPSIIFMDEPTSGLDARAASIVMRTIKNTVNTGRTVVCTIHQPSIDIFEYFDELLLLKRGGRVIYAGELSDHSHKLVEYFENTFTMQANPGVPRITEGHYPATWMLEVSSTLAEVRMNIDFAEIYANSMLYRKNQELIKELSIPPPGFQDLLFATKYSQSFYIQCVANFWKQYKSYWKNPPYNGMRYLVTFLYGLFFGTVFWQKGTKLDSQQDLNNLLGATYAAVFFIGATNCMSVQPVVSIERAVFDLIFIELPETSASDGTMHATLSLSIKTS
uniref:ABC transporter domain-containing protein n=1 Tax=Oryza glumipatula TaxID=40148 RepID=A0A0D9YPS0_9ORYZ